MSKKRKPGQENLAIGILKMRRSGDAYMTGPQLKKDVVIRKSHLGTALPGDEVSVRVYTTRNSSDVSAFGKVVGVLKRSSRDIVGTLESSGRTLTVLPVDPSFKTLFRVPGDKGANIGDRVVIKLIRWDAGMSMPDGEIVEVLGSANEPSIDTLSVIRQYGLKDTFPDAVIREADDASRLMDQPGERLDIRKKFIFTVDPKRARDFDDALSLEMDGNGNRVLGVHIADVSHFVRKGGALDKEAFERGNSVYLPDKVIPMLPENLSNGVCSLRPNEDRLAFSVFMTVDSEGRVIKRRFARTIIRSRLRLTYRQALGLLRGDEKVSVKIPDAAMQLSSLHKLAQLFRKRRFAKHALDLDIPDCEIVLNKSGVMTGVKIVDNDISHQLIEECMVAANEAVAAELASRGIPSLARLHEPPARDKIEDLAQELRTLGYKPGNLNVPANLSAFLKQIKDDPLAYHVRICILRSMNRAIYSSKGTGHFGLAKKYYSHFTSPIRRYPDLVVHRQLAEMLGGKKSTAHGRNKLAAVAKHCSLTEEEAERAERSVIEIKKYRYLQQQIDNKKPRVYDAVVTNVMRFGVFVEVLDLQVRGLLPADCLKNAKFSHTAKSMRSGRDLYKLGLKVKVYVSNVDFDNRRIDFALA